MNKAWTTDRATVWKWAILATAGMLGGAVAEVAPADELPVEKN